MFPPMVQGYCPAWASGQLAETLSACKQGVYCFDLFNLAGAFVPRSGSNYRALSPGIHIDPQTLPP